MATVTAWAWDFGDGTTSSLQNPSHIYSQPGYYQLQHEQWDDSGEHSIINYEIGILGYPSHTYDYYWTYGDGTFSQIADTTTTSHDYIYGGINSSGLTIKDIWGSVSTAANQSITLTGDTLGCDIGDVGDWNSGEIVPSLGVDIGDVGDWNSGEITPSLGVDIGDVGDWNSGEITPSLGVDIGDLIGTLSNPSDTVNVLGTRQPTRRRRKRIFIVA